MSRAFELARQGYYSSHPNPRVGCVITQENRIVGEGFHFRAGEAHAEVAALRAAGDAAHGATVYVTLEPCCHQGRTPPCVDALIAARVARVVFAVSDPNPSVAGAGAQQLRNAGIIVDSGIMAASGLEINRGFFRRMREKRPFVTLKVGMTLDARVALADGTSKWITSSAARADVQRLRAASGAIVTGVGTLTRDDPALTVRDQQIPNGGRQPLRVILDTDLRSPLASQVFNVGGQTLVFTDSADDRLIEQFTTRGVLVERCRRSTIGLDLGAVMRRLAQMEINDVLVEAGPRVLQSFLEQGLVDEIVAYVAPKIFGSKALAAFSLAPPSEIAAALSFDIAAVRRVGPDLRVTLTPLTTA